MELDVYIEGRRYQVQVDPELLAGGRELFDKMDRDMDVGVKLGPEFIESPGPSERAQYAASRLMLALESGREATAQAMAAYIMARLPQARSVYVDTTGEPTATEFRDADGHPVE